MAGFRLLLRNTPQGLYCPPGDFHIDPTQPVDHAVITHGHSDHARAGHGTVLATPETLAIMAARCGEDFAGSSQAARYGEAVTRGSVKVTLVPAGGVLGAGPMGLWWEGCTPGISGGYKSPPGPPRPPLPPGAGGLFVSGA